MCYKFSLIGVAPERCDGFSKKCELMSTTVLIIDDSDTVRSSVREALEPTDMFDHFEEAKDGMEGFKVLINQSVDLVLCDVVMPGTDGFRFLRLKKSKVEFADIPVIMLTGQGQVETKVRTLGAGASDYITKPFHAEELVARARVHVSLKLLRNEMKEKNRRLEELTRTDPLTGLANRRYFLECFETESSRAQRHNLPISYVMMDLDHFKAVNDNYGHIAGDNALVMVADVMKTEARNHDVAGRYGGEEFVFLLPETDGGGALVFAERCREAIAAGTYNSAADGNGEDLSVTASVGVCSREPHGELSIDDLMRKADAALYEAKEGGRNCVVVADPDD